MAHPIYLCDSGKILPVFVASAVMCSDQGWAALCAQWELLLRCSPSLTHLDMTDAARLQGQFRGWSVAERDRRIDRFANLVNESATRCAASLVPLEAYQEFFLRVRRPKLTDMPFLFAVMGLMDQMHPPALDRQSIRLCYRETQGRVPDAVAAWQYWKSVAPSSASAPSLVTLDYCEDARAIPLQVAALIGALARSRFLDARLKSPDGRAAKMPQSCSSSRISYQSRIWTAEELRQARDSLQAYRRPRRRPVRIIPRLSAAAAMEAAI